MDEENLRDPREQRCEERDPVLAVDDDVVATAKLEQVREHHAQVQGEAAPDAADANPVEELGAAAALVALRQPADVHAHLGKPPADLVHVDLGAAGPRVADVTPVDDQDAERALPAAERRDLTHAGTEEAAHKRNAIGQRHERQAQDGEQPVDRTGGTFGEQDPQRRHQPEN